MRKQKNLPTDRELMLLKLLWKMKEATVRQVSDELNRDLAGQKGAQDLALTTVTTFLNTMVDKGLVAKSKTTGRFKYSAVISKEEGSTRMIKDLARRLGDDARRLLMAGLLEDSDINEAELKSLRKLVDQKLNRVDRRENLK